MADWFRRYAPAECGGLALAFIASFAARRATGNAIVAAYAAAWGETIGYASVIAVRDFVAERRRSRHHARTNARHAGNVLLELLAEFGPAGVIDTFVTRPMAMAAGVKFFGPVLGLIAGKLAADVVFYAPVIYMYERRKRRKSAARGPGH